MPTYSSVWSGSSDPASLQSFIDQMKASQFVVTTIKAADDGSTPAFIVVDMVQSGVIPQPPAPSTPAPPPPPGATPKEYAMDMSVFGISDLSSIPSTGEFQPIVTRTSAASGSPRPFDPMIALIFLAASVLVFWG